MNLLLAVVAGLMLGVSDHPLHWWPLQFVAFVPFWYGLSRQFAAGRGTWSFGFAFGLAYTGVILSGAGIAAPVLAAAAAGLVHWTIAAPIAARCLARGPVLGPLGAAAALTLLELAVWHLVPLFGTAQAFVRPLSAAPMSVAFVAYTGVGGLVFVVAAVQGLAVSMVRGAGRWRAFAAMVVLLGVVAALDVVRWQRPLGESHRVAAFGWGTTTPNSPDGSSTVQIAAMMANGEQCRLLVTPEAAMWVSDREKTIEYLHGLATEYPMSFAMGVWHAPTNDNRIWFFDAQSSLLGEYRKSHLVPFFEDYPVGDAVPTIVPFEGTTLGGMICQDDNFTDVARAHGRAGAPIVAIPTNDWPDIREFHLENSIFRAIENGYAVVRAASAGISALITPRGEVAVRCDHVTDQLALGSGASNLSSATSGRLQGARLIHADLPIGDGVPTMYARFGDWPVGLLAGCLLLLSWRRRRSLCNYADTVGNS